MDVDRGCGRQAGRAGARRHRPVCFVFLDGVGLAAADGHNPLAQAVMPTLHNLLGGPLVDGRRIAQDGVLLQPLDACLGVSGLPQSATGQTALFTGINAAALLGAHMAAYPTAPLREVIAQHSLLKQATDLGLRATFANAYTTTYWQRVAQRKLWHSASTLATMAADLPFRTLGDLARGEAVYWDITHEVLRSVLELDVPLLEPEEAGRRLARLTAAHDLVLFESFLTDLAGHGRLPWPTEEVLTLLDRFLGGLLEALPDEATLLVSSDHGNLEDSRTRAHTRNPVPLLAVGPGARAFAQAQAITDVTPAILQWFQVQGSRFKVRHGQQTPNAEPRTRKGD